MADNKEREFSRALRLNWQGWSSFFEPAIGSDFGIPDCEIFVWGHCVHVELKIASIVSGKVKSREIRPAQIIWHRDATAAGVRCCFLYAVDDGENWVVFGNTIEKAAGWKIPFVVGEDVKLISTLPKKGSGMRTAFSSSIMSFVLEAFGS